MKKLDSQAVELADSLHSAAIHLLRRVRSQDRASGVGPAQLSALSVLVFGGQTSLGDLAAAEQVKPPTMVRIVQALNKDGLVTARPDRQDRRKLVISPTARGRQVMLRARERRVRALAELVAEIGDTEQQRLREAVDIIRRLLGR